MFNEEGGGQGGMCLRGCEDLIYFFLLRLVSDVLRKEIQVDTLFCCLPAVVTFLVDYNS